MKQLNIVILLLATFLVVGATLSGCAEDPAPTEGPQMGTISGTVSDADGTLSGASVSITGGNSTSADGSGFYSLEAEAGSRSVRASKSGYSSRTNTVTVVADQTVTANFTLEVLPPNTDPIVAKWELSVLKVDGQTVPEDEWWDQTYEFESDGDGIYWTDEITGFQWPFTWTKSGNYIDLQFINIPEGQEGRESELVVVSLDERYLVWGYHWEGVGEMEERYSKVTEP